MREWFEYIDTLITLALIYFFYKSNFSTIFLPTFLTFFLISGNFWLIKKFKANLPKDIPNLLKKLTTLTLILLLILWTMLCFQLRMC